MCGIRVAGVIMSAKCGSRGDGAGANGFVSGSEA